MPLLYMLNSQTMQLLLVLMFAVLETAAPPVTVRFCTLGTLQVLTSVPGVEAGVALVSDMYKDFFRVELDVLFPMDPRVASCLVFGDYVTQYTAEYYYQLKRNSTAHPEAVFFLGASCFGEVMMLAPLAAGLNVFYNSFITTATQVANKALYPTTITSSVINQPILLQSVHALFKYYHWSDAHFLCDDNNTIPFYVAFCANIPKTMEGVRFGVTHFNTAQKSADYAGLLDTATKLARVILLIANTQNVRPFLVYVTGIPFRHKDYHTLKWKEDDGYDEAAKDAFRQLFLLTFDSDRIADSFSDATKAFIIERSASAYNYTYGKDEVIDPTAAAGLDATLLLANAINDSLSAGGADLSDAVTFTRRFFNRTYHLPTGSLYLNKNGERMMDCLIRQVNQTNGNFETVIFYTSANFSWRQFEYTSGITWIDGRVPRGRPACGFIGDDPVCASRENRTIVIALGVVTAAGIIAVVAAINIYSRLTMTNLDWCMLDSKDVQPLLHRRTVRDMLRQSSMISKSHCHER